MDLHQVWSLPVLISQPLPFVKAFVEAIDEARSNSSASSILPGINDDSAELAGLVLDGDLGDQLGLLGAL